MLSKAADVRRQVIRTIENHDLLKNVRHVILGFSGGPDSMCLLHVLNSIRLDSTSNFELHPVHVNHGIRKGICDQEQFFCEEYSRSLGLECRSFVYDCEGKAKEWGMTTEEAGRKIRYDSFDIAAAEILASANAASQNIASANAASQNSASANAASQSGAAEVKINKDSIVVAVAQNADDQAETVLMRVLRGTGIQGLSGIPYDREDERGYRVVRPLLDVFKSDILDYCEEFGLEPRMDLTNQEPAYHRNKIRLELIPYLEEHYNPNIKETLIRLSDSARGENEYLDKRSNESYERIAGLGTSPCDGTEKEGETEHSRATINKCIDTKRLTVDNNLLREMDDPIRRRVINHMLRDIGLSDDVGYDHYRMLNGIVKGDNPSAHVDLPKGYSAHREYDNLVLCGPPNSPSNCMSMPATTDHREMSAGQTQPKLTGLSAGQTQPKLTETTADKAESGHREIAADQDVLSGTISIEKLSVNDYEKMNLPSGSFAAFDYDELAKQYGEDGLFDLIKIRERKPGDVIRLKVGTKKIQDIATDDKIPLSRRDEIKVIAIGSEVLWFIAPRGYRSRWTSDCQITPNTGHVLLIKKSHRMNT